MEVPLSYRFLEPADRPALYRAFVAAFADYSVPFQLSEEDFAELLARRGADDSLSVGAWDGEEMVAFWIAAAGTWQGRPTAYDISTGVLPAYRGRRIAGQLLAYAEPTLRQRGLEDYLLEVIQGNRSAVRTYLRCGFEVERELLCFTLSPDELRREVPAQHGVGIETLGEAPWERWKDWWSFQPSWQNSVDSIRRSPQRPLLFEAEIEGETVGYAALFPKTGDLAQLAVARRWRRQGVGSALLRQAVTELAPGRLLRVVNVDARDRATAAFLTRLGAREHVRQFEMRRRGAD